MVALPELSLDAREDVELGLCLSSEVRGALLRKPMLFLRFARLVAEDSDAAEKVVKELER